MDTAKIEPQNDRIDLQDKLQPWHIVAVAVLGICAFKPELIWVVAGMGIAGYVAWSIAEKNRIAREAAARVASWANICGAQVVQSYDPNEGPDVVAERAKQWRENLRMSGNIYWQEIPIIEYPFQPMIFGLGQLTYAWDIYQRMVGEKRHTENLKWVEGKCPIELRGAVLSQILPAPKTEEI